MNELASLELGAWDWASIFTAAGVLLALLEVVSMRRRQREEALARSRWISLEIIEHVHRWNHNVRRLASVDEEGGRADLYFLLAGEKDLLAIPQEVLDRTARIQDVGLAAHALSDAIFQTRLAAELRPDLRAILRGDEIDRTPSIELQFSGRVLAICMALDISIYFLEKPFSFAREPLLTRFRMWKALRRYRRRG